MILEKHIQFEIPLTPRQKNNSRPIFKNKKTGKMFIGKSKTLSEYEKNAGLILNAAKARSGINAPLSGQICAVFIFEFSGVCRSDGDNLTKCAQDLAATAGIIENDRFLKHVEFEIIEHTGAPDKTIMKFGCCLKHSKVEDVTGRVSREKAIQGLQKIAKESPSGQGHV